MPRIILIDEDDEQREVLASRLRALGYFVDAVCDPLEGAQLALSAPPAAVIADLWMRSISGVQLCRLLKSEPATQETPVILRAANDEPRNRFWAEHAGATDYTRKGGMAALARALRRAVSASEEGDGFFTQLPSRGVSVRDRIAAYSDRALFRSVVAAEVRALGTCANFERLFDLFCQLASQICAYRWLALDIEGTEQLAIHAHPSRQQEALAELLDTLGGQARCLGHGIYDDDASSEWLDTPPAVAPIRFGDRVLGRLIIAPVSHLRTAQPSGRSEEPDSALADVVAEPTSWIDDFDSEIAGLLAHELAGPLRIVALVEESRRLASQDTLTGLLTRRAFIGAARPLLASLGAGACVCLLDVDLFKRVNDDHGHAAGDRVLVEVGGAISKWARAHGGIACRWGGEEFTTLLPLGGHTVLELGEQMRQIVAASPVKIKGGELSVTASVGVSCGWDGAQLEVLIEYADQGMYQAKSEGRNTTREKGRGTVTALALAADG